MSMGHAGTHEIRNPGSLEVAGGFRTLLMVFALAGAACFVAGLSASPTRAWASFVHNHFYFLSLALGGAFFASIQWLTGAMWSAPVRRLSEAFTAYLPIALVMFIVLCFGIHHLYSWSHMEHVKGDIVLEGKTGYLNVGFFIARNVFSLLVWIFFARKMIGNSIAQDSHRDYAFTLRNRTMSPVFLLLFGLTFTLMSFDLMMSLDPHWFSTIFGVYCFAGLFYANLASTCLLAIYVRSKKGIKDVINDNHLHDLGKFMFAFTIFWAYIGFSQFMLIWYANLPEETTFYLTRMNHGWLAVSIFLLVGKFATPFFLLLPRDAKRNVKMLSFVAVFMLVAQWIDILWLVQPQFFTTGPVIGWIEIGVTLGFLGLFGLATTYFLSKYNVVAIGDPRLQESVFHHHQ